MLDTKVFGGELKRFGFNFFTGVPCSFLKPLINYAINSDEYIAAVNEGDAVTIAGGAYLGGRKSIVLMQNSGLTNAISPLTSFNYTFRLPVLGFVSLRGESGLKDEPQHELMGQITTNMLDLIKVKWEYLSQDIETAKTQLIQANNIIADNETFFFVVKKGTFAEEELKNQEIKYSQRNIIIKKSSSDKLPIRLSALQVINKLKDNNTVQLATTGKTGRELYEAEDASNNLYMVGSMGCISSLGLGLALTRKDKDIVVIDGDGSLLMRMGSLATTGYYQPENMIHILLDNGSHDSTGGQATVSGNVDFIDVAGACGYNRSVYVHNLDELEGHIRTWKKEKGLTFLYMKISKGSSEQLGRPSVKPYQVKERLMGFLNE